MSCLNDNQKVGDNFFATLCTVPDPLHAFQQFDTLLRVHYDGLHEFRLTVREATQQQNATQGDILNSECEMMRCWQHLQRVRKLGQVQEHDGLQTSLTISPIRRPPGEDQAQPQWKIESHLQFFAALMHCLRDDKSSIDVRESGINGRSMGHLVR